MLMFITYYNYLTSVVYCNAFVTLNHLHLLQDCVKEPASPLKSSSSGTWSTDSQDNGGFTTVTYKGAWGKTKKSSPLPNDGLHPGSHAVSEVSHTHD